MRLASECSGCGLPGDAEEGEEHEGCPEGGGRFYHNYKALQEVWARDMFMKGRQVL